MCQWLREKICYGFFRGGGGGRGGSLCNVMGGHRNTIKYWPVMVCYDLKKNRPAMEIPLHLKLTTPGYHFARVFLSFLLLWMIYCSSHYDAKTTVHLYIFFHFMNNTVKIHNRKNLHVPYLLKKTTKLALKSRLCCICVNC